MNRARAAFKPGGRHPFAGRRDLGYGSAMRHAAAHGLKRWMRIAPLVLGLCAGHAHSAEPGPHVLFLNPAKRESGGAIEAPRALRFITVDGFAPFSAFDPQGQLRGIHVDLARALCVELETPQACTIQVVAFKDVEEILTSGQADAALAGIVPEAGNTARLTFSQPYARLPARFAANTTSTSKDAGVVEGSVHAAMAAALFPGRSFTSFPDGPALLAALKAGTIGTAFGDGAALGLWTQSADAGGCCTLAKGGYFLPALRADALRIAFPATRPELAKAVERALRDIQLAGGLDEIMLRHLPVDLTR
jgi:polar amino acid transport system substrate-binding protein